MAASRYVSEIPFGVLELENEIVAGIKEKPKEVHFCNAGIYLIDPDLLSMVPDGEFFDFTDLMKRHLSSK